MSGGEKVRGGTSSGMLYTRVYGRDTFPSLRSTRKLSSLTDCETQIGDKREENPKTGSSGPLGVPSASPLGIHTGGLASIFESLLLFLLRCYGQTSSS